MDVSAAVGIVVLAISSLVFCFQQDQCNWFSNSKIWTLFFRQITKNIYSLFSPEFGEEILSSYAWQKPASLNPQVSISFSSPTLQSPKG